MMNIGVSGMTPWLLIVTKNVFGAEQTLLEAEKTQQDRWL
jgi:hypothetical protein